ncbi:MAG TPA: helix-hairpin-helix domain-containing protein [Anaerolineales bacterium]
MRAFKVFIFGLLYGWFIKIAFDRIYRENEIEDLQNENAALNEYIESLEMRARSGSQEAISTRRQQSAPQALPVEAPAQPPASEKDDLKVIRGIGPAIERKLNNAGIHTFAELSQMSPEQLEGILGKMVKRLQDEDDLIAQARELARQR